MKTISVSFMMKDLKTHPEIPANNIVRTPDMISEAVKRLHDIYGLGYREIAELYPFNQIPPGTLCSIAHGYVPKKWYEVLGIIAPVEVMPCPTCKVVHLGKCPQNKPRRRQRTPGGWVNAKDPKKAAAQLVNRAEYDIADLIMELEVLKWKPPKK